MLRFSADIRHSDPRNFFYDFVVSFSLRTYLSFQVHIYFYNYFSALIVVSVGHVFLSVCLSFGK